MNRINQKLATVGAAVAAVVGISYWKINQNRNTEDKPVEYPEKKEVWISDTDSSGIVAEAVFKQDEENDMSAHKSENESVGGDKDKDEKNKNEKEIEIAIKKI